MVKEIKRRAEEKGLDLAKVERAAGIGRSTILRWDNISPSIDKVQRVAAVLECKVDDLIRDEGAADESAMLPAS